MKRIGLFIAFVFLIMDGFGQNGEAQDAAYNLAIAKADSAYEFRSYVDSWKPGKTEVNKLVTAKHLYEKASELNDLKSYPKDRIKEIDKQIENVDKYNEDSRRDQASKRYIRSADSLLEIHNYLEARKSYAKSDSIAKSKYAEESVMLSDEAASIQPADSSSRFVSLVQKADGLFLKYLNELARDGDDRELLAEAVALYKQARNLNKDSKLIQSKLKVTDAPETQSPKTQFKRAVANGDRFYKSKNYPEAFEQYLNALELKPEEKYPAEMLLKIEFIEAKQSWSEMITKRHENRKLEITKTDVP